MPAFIELDDVPVLPELMEPEDEPVDPIEPLDVPVPPAVAPERSGDVIGVEPPAPPIGAVLPPVEGEPVLGLAPPGEPVPVDCATAMLLPMASATPAARLINLGYLLMIWLPVSV